jgi:hypothetical protein
MRGETKLLSPIALKVSTFQKLFLIMTIVAIFSIVGSSVSYAQTAGTYKGQGNQGQQFSQRGNSTGHQHTGGSYSGAGTFSRNGTAYNMNSFNHTRAAYPGSSGVMSSTNVPTLQKPVPPSTGAITSNPATTNQPIPSWVKNNAKWWSQGQVSDSDFVQGIQYLIQNGMVKVPPTEVNTTSSQPIPQWVKNTANWWAIGQVSDNEFIQSIQYLISAGIIKA